MQIYGYRATAHFRQGPDQHASPYHRQGNTGAFGRDAPPGTGDTDPDDPYGRFPGEGEEEFQELLEFVREQRFERMGAFAYSEEEGTWGQKNLDDNVSQEVKQERLDRLMELQQQISEEHNRSMVGRTVTVLVEEFTEDGRYAGRTQWDSPDVDCQVIFDSEEPVEPGEYVEVNITGNDEFDLYGNRV